MAEHDTTYRPRVPRETQRLLITALLALGTIWALARIRFEEPTTANPVTPLLTQLGGPYRLSDIAREIADASERITPWLAAADVNGRPVLRLRGEIGLVHLPVVPAHAPFDVLAHDAATALGIVRIPDGALRAAPQAWTPIRDRPVHLFAALAATGRITASPVLVEILQDTTDPAWPGTLWRVRTEPAVAPGTFLFSDAGTLAGHLIDSGGARAIVPVTALVQEANRLLQQAPAAPGTLGIEVAALTPPLAAATGSMEGVVVTDVDADSPAARHVRIGDVITTAGGAPVRSVAEWRARALRTAAGQSVDLDIVRRGQRSAVAIVAAPAAATSSTLGLNLRSAPGGSEVTAVARQSAAWRAGLREGDRIRQIGQLGTPSPAAIRRAYDAMPAGEAVVVGFTRAGTAHVVGLEKDAAR